MRFTIKNNAEVDMLTQEELRHHLDRTTVGWVQEQARGVARPRFEATATPAAGKIQLPATASKKQLGPEKGFVWQLERITAIGLVAGDILNVYRNAVTDQNLIGYITAASSFPIGGKPPILLGTERIFITQGLTFTTTSDVTINGEANEVSEPDLYKLL